MKKNELVEALENIYKDDGTISQLNVITLRPEGFALFPKNPRSNVHVYTQGMREHKRKNNEVYKGSFDWLVEGTQIMIPMFDLNSATISDIVDLIGKELKSIVNAKDLTLSFRANDFGILISEKVK